MEIKRYDCKDPVLMNLMVELKRELIKKPSSLNWGDLRYNGKDGVLLAEANGLRGVAVYRKFFPEQIERFACSLGNQLEADIVDEWGNELKFMEVKSVRNVFGYTGTKPLTLLLSLESFDRGKGIGKKIMEQLMEDDANEGILLASLPESRGFYERIGFDYTGVYAENKAHPIMSWMKCVSLK